MTTRKDFLKQSLGVGALALGGMMPGLSAKSYGAVIGANETLRFAAVGVNSRGRALAKNFAKQPQCVVSDICDVDTRAQTKCAKDIEKIAGNKPKLHTDIRLMLESKDFDGVIIATPDHWHAPGAMLAMKAGKHVYLEKPCSHSPEEGELLIQGAAKYNRLIQMGNQRRSWPQVVAAIEEVKNGTIGEVYYGKAWYTANRKPIGFGKETAVPEWLNWELWQGPAPRRNFRDNLVHYNWHWFWHWGTGEALNNGTHMIDLLRWGMGEDYPSYVNSIGGRLCYVGQDDWECPDTQMVSYQFADKKVMTLEMRSCFGSPNDGASVGVTFYGSKGTLSILGNKYVIKDVKGAVVKEVKGDTNFIGGDLMNPSEKLDSLHFANFFNAIRKGETLRSDITSGHKSTLMVQLANISQRVESPLYMDTTNGHILKNKKAQALWSREYEKGWEMTL